MWAIRPSPVANRLSARPLPYSDNFDAYTFFVHSLHPPAGLTPITDRQSILDAVDAWVTDAVTAEAKYGHIRWWDTGEVTDMSELFYPGRSGVPLGNMRKFNGFIYHWCLRVVHSRLSVHT